MMSRNLVVLPWWWVLRWVWLGEGIWVIYLTRERGLTLGEVLLFQAAYGIVSIVAEVPTGMIADRWGRRVSLVAGSVISVAAFLLFGAGTTVALLLGSYALFALSDALFSGADGAMLFDSLRALGRDAEFTRSSGRLNALTTAAIALFTVAGTAMTLWLPLSAPMLLSGILTLPSIVLALRLVEPPRAERRHTFAATGARALSRVARTPALWSSTLLMATTTATIVLMAHVMQPIVLWYGVPLWALGGFVAAQMAAATLGSWAAHPVGAAVPLRHLLWAMPVMSTLSLIAGVGHEGAWFAVFILPSIGWNVLSPHFMDYVARRAPDAERATVISVTSVIGHVTTIVTSLVAGRVIDTAGLDTALVGAAIALTAASALAYAAWWRAGDLDAAPAGGPIVEA